MSALANHNVNPYVTTTGTTSGPWDASRLVGTDARMYDPVTNTYYTTPPEPKYPGHHCKSYAEFRSYIHNCSDAPQWVKEVLGHLDKADPWAAEMWGEVFRKWTATRAVEINRAADRLTTP